MYEYDLSAAVRSGDREFDSHGLPLGCTVALERVQADSRGVTKVTDDTVILRWGT